MYWENNLTKSDWISFIKFKKTTKMRVVKNAIGICVDLLNRKQFSLCGKVFLILLRILKTKLMITSS